jgi:hypothetical protein
VEAPSYFRFLFANAILVQERGFVKTVSATRKGKNLPPSGNAEAQKVLTASAQ